MEPDNLRCQGRWSFYCGLSLLSPDGGYCCWSISPHRSPPRSSTWTLSCSMSHSCTGRKHNTKRTHSSRSSADVSGLFNFKRNGAQKTNITKIVSNSNRGWKQDNVATNSNCAFIFYFFCQAQRILICFEWNGAIHSSEHQHQQRHESILHLSNNRAQCELFSLSEDWVFSQLCVLAKIIDIWHHSDSLATFAELNCSRNSSMHNH